jgi:hypothetical protein
MSAIGTRSVFDTSRRSAKAHLFQRFVVPVQLCVGVSRVHHGQDGIQSIGVLDIVINEKGLCHRRRIGQPGGLDDHPLEIESAGGLALRQFAEDADQIATHRAADAAIVHHHDLLVGSTPPATRRRCRPRRIRSRSPQCGGHDARARMRLSKRGLAGAEEAGEDGDGDKAFGHTGLRWVIELTDAQCAAGPSAFGTAGQRSSGFGRGFPLRERVGQFGSSPSCRAHPCALSVKFSCMAFHACSMAARSMLPDR